MYSNHPAVQAFLERGGTLVVPSRQRASAIALAYTAAQLQRGLATWDSPDVLHWSAWQGRQLDAVRQPHAGAVRRLATIEEWFLWREALDHPEAAHGLVQPDNLVDDLQRADEMIDAWGLSASATTGVEGALFNRLRQYVGQRRQQLQIAGRSGWRDTPADSRVDIWCLGFDEIGRADRRALEALGARSGGTVTPGAGPQPEICAEVVAPRVVCAADPDAEAALIADWCRRHLQRDPRARLLVLMPRPSLQQLPLRAALLERLGGDSVLRGAESESLFAVEGGTPLLQFPLVSTAQAWLRLVCDVLEFVEYSALLRSDYLRAGGTTARTRLEVWLRGQHLTALHPRDAARLSSRVLAELGADAEQVLALLGRLHVESTGRERPAVWAQRWVDWLQAAGWPGESALGSREQQVRQRFEQLLGELAQLGDVAGDCTAGQALAWLDGWLRRASFEPASGDVPVTVSSALRDPLLRYDGIWVCGLTAADWPPAAAFNPFVSLPGLLAAGSDAGTANGALRRAEEAMHAWSRSTADLVCSWPRQVGDALLQPSPLLPDVAVARQSADAMAKAAEAGIRVPSASPWRTAQVDRERYGAVAARPWPAGHTARGGVSVLEQQSRCPFQGFALGRLHSDRLELPQAGITAPMHGIVLHEALRRLWRDLGDSATLLARQGQLETRVGEAVAQSLRTVRRQSLVRLPEALWDIEAARCERLIQRLLALELQRPPFAVVATEQPLAFSACGVGLRFKLDRLDRAADGAHVLIDYKSGRLRRFNSEAARPEYPQLLAYASALEEPLCAVASAHLHVEGSGWQGAADTDARLPQVRAAHLGDAGWEGLLRYWRGQVHALLGEFATGESRVDPQPGACDACHLDGLCRVADRALAADGESERG